MVEYIHNKDFVEDAYYIICIKLILYVYIYIYSAKRSKTKIITLILRILKSLKKVNVYIKKNI